MPLAFASLGRTFWLSMLAAAATVAISGTAFTASLSGSQASKTATSATVIGGYTVTSVGYTLGAQPTNIDAITFTIVAPGAQPSTVKAQGATGGTFYSCLTVLNIANYDATCASTSPQLTVLAADNLTLVVSQ